jgi:hypothetical protein
MKLLVTLSPASYCFISLLKAPLNKPEINKSQNYPFHYVLAQEVIFRWH